MFWNKYPYTDFHEMNLDWFLKHFKEFIECFAKLRDEWGSMEKAWEEFNDKFAEHLSDTVKASLDEMYQNGELEALVSKFVGYQANNPMVGNFHVVTNDDLYNSWPTLVSTTNSTVLCIYMKSKSHLSPFKSVCCKISTDRGFTFGDEIVLFEGSEELDIGYQCYSALQLHTGNIIMAVTTFPGGNQGPVKIYSMQPDASNLNEIAVLPNFGTCYKPFTDGNGNYYMFRNEIKVGSPDNEISLRLYVTNDLGLTWTDYPVIDWQPPGNPYWVNLPNECEGLVYNGRIIGIGRSSIVGTPGYLMKADIADLNTWTVETAGFTDGLGTTYSVVKYNDYMCVTYVSRANNSIYASFTPLDLIYNHNIVGPSVLLGFTGQLTGSINVGYNSVIFNSRNEFLIGFYTNNTAVGPDAWSEDKTAIAVLWFNFKQITDAIGSYDNLTANVSYNHAYTKTAVTDAALAPGYRLLSDNAVDIAPSTNTNRNARMFSITPGQASEFTIYQRMYLSVGTYTAKIWFYGHVGDEVTPYIDTGDVYAKKLTVSADDEYTEFTFTFYVSGRALNGEKVGFTFKTDAEVKAGAITVSKGIINSVNEVNNLLAPVEPYAKYIHTIRTSCQSGQNTLPLEADLLGTNVLSFNDNHGNDNKVAIFDNTNTYLGSVTGYPLNFFGCNAVQFNNTFAGGVTAVLYNVLMDCTPNL